MITSADDHLVKKFSLLWKIFHQFILGHPNMILALPDIILVGCNYLRFKEESLTKEKESKKGVKNFRYKFHQYST